MRVMFATLATRSHFYTQVSLAWALRAAGHEVCVASQPDLVDDINRAGLTAAPVGVPLKVDEMMQESDRLAEVAKGTEGVDWSYWPENLDLGETRPEKLTYDYVHGVLTSHAALVFPYVYSERAVGELVEFARWWKPDLVIWDTLTFAGGVAARACGAAHARLLFGLDLVGWVRQAHNDYRARRPPPLREDPMEEWLGPILEGHGSRFGEDAVVGQWTIDPSPASLRLPVRHLTVPMRYVPYNGPSTIPEWLRRPPRRPRICLTLGVAFREVVGGDRVSVSDLLDSIAELDVDVIATLNDGQIPPGASLPSNVKTVDFVPLDALLPSCSAVIHHGGAGTFHTALKHGVPQVIVPSNMWDATHQSRHLANAGAGLYARSPSPDRLRSILGRVLTDPSFRHGAARLRAETLAAPSPSALVPTLERLTGYHRGSDSFPPRMPAVGWTSGITAPTNGRPQ